MDKKCPCGMPLDEKTTCACDDTKCVHCCECGPECDTCKEQSVQAENDKYEA